ncbi:MAG: nucleotidyltransferase domain-containing protein [Anaerolineales bacterium]|nr:nucleotidyltransferase domain-containing protein [Anaerolineales bacterium]
MADKSVVKSIQKYLQYIKNQGIPVRFGVLYGSYVKESVHEWSDIDLLVVSPKYDKEQTNDDIEQLWMFAARTDSRIEPIPVGEHQYAEDDSSAIIEIARREGEIISLAE